MERVCRLTNKIYQKMLCVTRHERMSYITLSPAGHDHVQARAFWIRTPQYRIVLSWELLAWILVEGNIPCSFTNFITVPELSGPMYVSPDIYHTQITEYLLWAPVTLHRASSYCYFVRHYYSFSTPDWSLWEHLSHAIPTEMIFYQLRSTRSDRLIRDYSSGLMLDTLEIIIKWLQVSVSEYNWQTLQTENSICVQELGSERPSDLYDRFQGELLRYKSWQSALLTFKLNFKIWVYQCDQCNQYLKHFFMIVDAL